MGSTQWMVLGFMLLAAVALAEPIRLHPDNPHYFLFRGQPEVLITSGEHYGAVLNLDFDYTKYLDTLAAEGLNNTRTFVGSYCEPDGAFKIARNTLAPTAGRFICPWARSETPGYSNGGNKFDLTKWDEAYFTRLHDFLAKASHRGIVVEVNLFCPFYGDAQWQLSPMNTINNTNGIGNVAREQAYAVDGEAALLAVQEAMTREIVTRLNGYDNIYFEIMNEPYIRAVPDTWERHIADVIVDAERSLPNKHIISQNIANGKKQVTDPHPAISLLNFHYAFPPETVALNYDLKLAIGDNETGFKGTGDDHYRMEGWAFILAGGALYNNLDYSFTVGHEDGTFEYPDTQPGGGTAPLRQSLRALYQFMHGFDFIRMEPAPSVIAGGLPKGVSASVLAERGKQYAIYLYGDPKVPAERRAQLSLTLPAGEYWAAWVDPLNGEVIENTRFEHAGGEAKLASPEFNLDIALQVRRVGE